MNTKHNFDPALSSKFCRYKDESLQQLKRSQKLLTSLRERRNQNKTCSPNNITSGQESLPSNCDPLNKNESQDNHSTDSSQEDTTKNSSRTPRRTPPLHSDEKSENLREYLNSSNVLVSTMSTDVGYPKNQKEETCAIPKQHTGVTAQELTTTINGANSANKMIYPPRYEDVLNLSNNKEMNIPTIVVWPDNPGEDLMVHTSNTDKHLSRQAAILPRKTLHRPPPPRLTPAVENLNSSNQPEKTRIQDGKQEESVMKIRNDIRAEDEKNGISKSETSEIVCSKSIDQVEEDDVGDTEEKKSLLGSKKGPLRRRAFSADHSQHFGRNTFMPIPLSQSKTSTTESEDVRNSSLTSDAEHPTMGESLNNLVSQTLHDNEKIANGETDPETEPNLDDIKKRRSFCDMLMELPRKLSHVSEAELGHMGHIPPLLRRGLGNRKPRKSAQETTEKKKEIENNNTLKDCFFIILSGMYGLIIVVLGAVVPISETFAVAEPPNFFDAFYIYLFTCSSLFILYVYTFLLRRNKKPASFKFALNRTWSRSFIRSWSFTSRSDNENAGRTDSWYRRKITTDLAPHNPNGSFYLRLGAVGFGIGGMIHSGLQLGTHFEGIGGNSECDSRIEAINPLFHLTFTFSQLYFVFLNPKVCIHRYKTFARFGLMHMCGTNICVWFRNIVVETLHEMHHGAVHHDDHLPESHTTDKEHGSNNISFNVSHFVHSNVTGKNMTHETGEASHSPDFKCYWTNMMSDVVNRAAPYLYPCSIEYSLICAGIMYVLWQQVGRGPKPIRVRIDRKNKHDDTFDQIRNNRMSVDCGSSSRGLFVGILLFVGAVITMVAFYVLVEKNNMTITALALVHLSEIVIYLLGVGATICASWRMRGLAYRPGHASALENILILISLTGVFIFCIFGIIAAIFHEQSGLANGLSIASNMMMVIQSIFQTVFMIIAAELQAVTPKDIKKKQGREFVTFLILCNLSLWGINTFETQRSEHNPIQTDFYGHMAWAILTHISVPLGIFYRFHSTVCLSNIWKNAWKNKKH